MHSRIAYAVATACLASLPVLAQQVAPSTTVEANRAQALEEVLVTARRREENLQAVPTAISVIDGACWTTRTR